MTQESGGVEIFAPARSYEAELWGNTPANPEPTLFNEKWD
jgi:hypothetical protein